MQCTRTAYSFSIFFSCLPKKGNKDYHNPNYNMYNIKQVPGICCYHLSVCNGNSTSLHSLPLNNLNPDTTIVQLTAKILHPVGRMEEPHTTASALLPGWFCSVITTSACLSTL